MYVDMELSKPFTPSPASLFQAQEREPEGEAVVSFVEKTVHSGVAVNRNSTFFSNGYSKCATSAPLLLLSNNEKITLSESKAQSKLSKLELKADLFSGDTPLPGLASLTVFTAFHISEPDLLDHRHSLNELRYGLELSIYHM